MRDSVKSDEGHAVPEVSLREEGPMCPARVGIHHVMVGKPPVDGGCSWLGGDPFTQLWLKDNGWATCGLWRALDHALRELCRLSRNLFSQVFGLQTDI